MRPEDWRHPCTAHESVSARPYRVAASHSARNHAERARLGLAPAPRLVVVSASLDLPWSAEALTDPRPDVRPVIVTGADPAPDRLERATEQTRADAAAKMEAIQVAAENKLADIENRIKSHRRHSLGLMATMPAGGLTRRSGCRVRRQTMALPRAPVLM